MGGMLEQELIAIKLTADIKDVVTKFKQVRLKTKREINKIEQAMAKIKAIDMRTGLGKKTFSSKNAKLEELEKLKQQLIPLKQRLKELPTKQLEKILPKEKKLNNINRSLNKQRAIVNGMKKPFAGWALSLMFAGMALKQLGTAIWKSGTKTFQEISHSVEGTSTSFDLLAGSMKYLGFLVGSALEPVAAALIPIIDKISDLVEKNPKLVATFTELSIVLGTIFMVGGMGVLAINGFKDMAGKVGLVKTNAQGLQKFDWTGLGNTIRKGIGIGMIFIGIKIAKEASDDWASGKIFTGALKGVASAAYVAGGYFLFKGNSTAGIIMASVGFLIDNTAKGTLYTNLAKIIGVISALFVTAGQMIGYNFSQSFNTIVASEVTAFINRHPLMKEGLKLMGLYQKIEAKAAPKFDFGKAFMQNYVETIAGGIVLDKKLKGIIDKADANAQAIVKSNDVMYAGARLISDSMAKRVSEVGSEQLIKELLAADAAFNSAISDRGTAFLENKYKELTGKYIVIENVSITTNDLQDMIAQVQAISGA